MSRFVTKARSSRRHDQGDIYSKGSLQPSRDNFDLGGLYVSFLRHVTTIIVVTVTYAEVGVMVTSTILPRDFGRLTLVGWDLLLCFFGRKLSFIIRFGSRVHR